MGLKRKKEHFTLVVSFFRFLTQLLWLLPVSISIFFSLPFSLLFSFSLFHFGPSSLFPLPFSVSRTFPLPPFCISLVSLSLSLPLFL